MGHPRFRLGTHPSCNVRHSWDLWVVSWSRIQPLEPTRRETNLVLGQRMTCLSLISHAIFLTLNYLISSVICVHILTICDTYNSLVLCDNCAINPNNKCHGPLSLLNKTPDRVNLSSSSFFLLRVKDVFLQLSGPWIYYWGWISFLTDRWGNLRNWWRRVK